MKCTVKVPAKINLSLDVVGKRADGYHLLETIMQSIDLYDIITVSITGVQENINTTAKSLTRFQKASNDRIASKSQPNIKIIADNPTFPCDSRNTCYKAAEKFALAYENVLSNGSSRDTNQSTNNEKTGLSRDYNQSKKKEKTRLLSLKNKQIQIHIIKNIPQAAGLAGGSADAAAVLTALNNLCGFPFSKETLSQIGEKVGADVPFCLTGGTVLCTGTGEILESLHPLDEVPIVLIKPNFGVSTPWVFSKMNLNKLGQRPDTSQVIRFIKENDITKIFKITANVLESVTLPAYPILSKIKNTLMEHGATGSLMSGSGPTVFGVFATGHKAMAAAAKIKEMPEFSSYTVINTKTIKTGPVVQDD